MNEIKVFMCGKCKKDKRKVMIRSELRKHLEEEHGIKQNKSNTVLGRKQNHWIVRDFDDVVKEYKLR